MEKFVKGDVVVIPFPFSDLSEAKRRPALVIAEMEQDDVMTGKIQDTGCKTQDTGYKGEHQSTRAPVHQSTRIQDAGYKTGINTDVCRDKHRYICVHLCQKIKIQDTGYRIQDAGCRS